MRSGKWEQKNGLVHDKFQQAYYPQSHTSHTSPPETIGGPEVKLAALLA